MIDRKVRHAEWIKIRQQRTFELMQRDEMYCHYCHRALNDLASPIASKLAVDHIVPVSKGGTDDLDNLVMACSMCNSLKKDKSHDDFLKHIELIKTLESVGADYRRWGEEHLARIAAPRGEE